MTHEEFTHNAQGAETFRQLTDVPEEQYFWEGYLRGIRRHYHGERFGTADEHTKWMKLSDDETRRDLGDGYRAGFKGVPIAQVSREKGGSEHGENHTGGD